jgi:hypothetical protein
VWVSDVFEWLFGRQAAGAEPDFDAELEEEMLDEEEDDEDDEDAPER